MARILRRDTSGAASTVAVFLSLLVILLFLQITLVGVIPAQQYDAEFVASRDAIEAVAQLRALSAGYAPAGTSFSMTLPLGAPAVSPLASPTLGELRFDDGDPASLSISYRFFPAAQQITVTELNQDVVLLMDSSGSMNWNDPLGMRICGAQEYVASLAYPDRVAIIDFDDVSRLVRANHHLNNIGHNGIPDYSDPQLDLGTIARCNAPFSNSGATNFGAALRLGNDELVGYGNPNQEWVLILLTDGQNCCPQPNAAMNSLARAQAARAATLGITIYTIGLGPEADAVLLREIAETTGGTYYAAPTADSIRWIFLEISRRYEGAFLCGNFAVQESSFGAITLNLQNRQYPAQTIRMEGASIAILQSDGAAIQEGLPIEFAPTGPGSGALAMTVVTFVGTPFAATGFEPQVLNARTEVRDLQEQLPSKVDLGQEGLSIGNISAYVSYWAGQGAATPSAEAAIRDPLEDAQAYAFSADASASSGDYTSAKFDIDRAETQLSAAIAVVNDQLSQGQIQTWLAKSTNDQILASGCRLNQWRSWYDGITLTMKSPMASAWGRWFNETFRTGGPIVTVAVSGDTVVVSFHAIDSFTLDRRIVSLSLNA
ncbi:MAG TPA: vWA domain-containing protein [Thermoplasmata archaeon]